MVVKLTPHCRAQMLSPDNTTSPVRVSKTLSRTPTTRDGDPIYQPTHRNLNPQHPLLSSIPPPARPPARQQSVTMVSTRSSSAALPRSPKSESSPPPPPTKTPRKTPRSAGSRASASAAARGWAHAPSALTLLWMGVSLPLVAWDTGYVLLRPRSMPGGNLHWPLWVPYDLYGTIDHMYGFKQWSAGNGFTSAQGSLNLIETAMYLAYLWLWYSRAQPGPGSRRVLAGRAGGVALLLGFSAAVMTLSKTVLYCKSVEVAHVPTSSGAPAGRVPATQWKLQAAQSLAIFANRGSRQG